jgi:flagellar hook-basal body complex protein FliE
MSVIPVGAAAGASWPATEATQAATTTPTAPTQATGQVGGADNASGSFANLIGNAFDSMATSQASADSLATQAATGSLTNVADYMVAAEDANIQTQLTAAVRNNAMQAFQQIMGMQL